MRHEQRVRAQARKFGYRIYRSADGSYKLQVPYDDWPVIYSARLIEIDNFLKQGSPPQEKHMNDRRR